MENYDALFLCKTPLQARICLEILKRNNYKRYTIIYSASSTANIHKVSYKELSRNAIDCIYFEPLGLSRFFFQDTKRMKFLKKFLEHKRYDYIYLANIENHIFRYILKIKSNSIINGFDDGTANIFPSSAFHTPKIKTKIKSWVYRLPTISNIKDSIFEHYTLYKNFSNIVDDEKLIPIELSTSNLCLSDVRKEIVGNSLTDKVSVFIGQPFTKFLSHQEIKKLGWFLIENKVDYYLIHPAESAPLSCKAKYIYPVNFIAEDFILYLLSLDKQVVLYASFTTVLFNINNNKLKKIYLSVSGNHILESERIKKASMSGADVEVV